MFLLKLLVAWLVFFLIFIFFICIFSIIIFFIFKIIHKLKRTKSKITLKSLIIKFALSLFPIYYILFMAGGCSYKYMDWQYYEFKRLCEGEAGRIILNEKLYEDYRNPNYKQHKPNDIYRGRILEFSRGITYYDKKIISIHRGFIYYDYGIFLSGDEAGGFNLNFKKEIGCKENNRFKWINNDE